MKKIQLNTAKLQLRKEKITSLTNNQMSQILGGDGGDDDGGQEEFTYSLSLGRQCKESTEIKGNYSGHPLTKNAYECGIAAAIVSDAKA